MKKYLKVLMIVALAVLLVGTTFAATYAWLTAKTDTIVNTFTAGNISITLNETTGTKYKMVPGVNIEKDPKVTVEAKSEKCWLFVKIKEENFKVTEDGTEIALMSYAIAAGWTKLEDGVYYRQVESDDVNQEFYIIEGNKITVDGARTKEQFKLLDTKIPSLTITAYAVQFEGIADVSTAWDQAEALG